MKTKFIYAVFLALLGSVPLKAAEKAPVLVILSSEGKISLKSGKVHPTGFYLTELMGPLKKIVEAGYPVVFANPKGNAAILDKKSDNSSWLGDNEQATPEVRKKAQDEYQAMRSLCEQQGVCGKPGMTLGPKPLKTLKAVIAGGLDGYAGLLLPGGHAPMEDLWRNAEMKTILRHFHDPKTRKPTGLICHAPIALLAALDDPQGYISALAKDDRKTMFEKSRQWIYRGYPMTVFTTREEQQQEPGQDNALGDFVRFYPDEALEKAGAYVNRADKWKSNAVRHEELITGQNPFSHDAFGDLFLKALEEKN